MVGLEKTRPILSSYFESSPSMHINYQIFQHQLKSLDHHRSPLTTASPIPALAPVTRATLPIQRSIMKWLKTKRQTLAPPPLCIGKFYFFTNKLKHQIYPPTGSHLSKIHRIVANLATTLTFCIYGQIGYNEKLIGSNISFQGKKSFYDFKLF